MKKCKLKKWSFRTFLHEGDEIWKEPTPNAPQTKAIIKLLLKDINEIKQYTAAHSNIKLKNFQDILFSKSKINYFTEICTSLEPQLVLINLLVFHNLLPIRDGSECKLCRGVEYNIKHIMFVIFSKETSSTTFQLYSCFIWRFISNWSFNASNTVQGCACLYR